MHALADTGLEFIKYNNRALVSLSFIISLAAVFFYKFFFFNKKSFSYIILLLSFTILVTNFFYFQNNLIRDRYKAVNFYNQIEFRTFGKNHYDNIINFIVEIKQNSFDEIMSYNSMDYIHYLKPTDQSIYTYLNKDKFCNKNYYRYYINDAYLYPNKNSSVQKYIINLFIFKENELTSNKLNVAPENFYDSLRGVIVCKNSINNKYVNRGHSADLFGSNDTQFLKFSSSVYSYLNEKKIINFR